MTRYNQGLLVSYQQEVVYAVKGSKQSTLHVLELTGQRGTSFLYQPLGSVRLPVLSEWFGH